MLGNLEKEWECTLKSVELDIPRPEFSCRFGERFLKRNQFHQAIFWYELALRDPGNNASKPMEQNYPFKTWLPHKQLGLCYYRVGDYKRALSHNELARQYLPHDPDIEKNIRFLKKLADESTDQVQAEEGYCRSSLVQRYLDLLESSLIGTLIQDTPDDWRPGSKFDPEMRRLGRDWLSLSFSMIGSVRMRNLRYACETVLLDGVEGDFIETGVWRGGACILMRGILEAYGDDTRRVFVADSFAGLPPPDPENFSADAGSRLHTFNQLKVSRADVEDNFRRFGLLDGRVVFIEGWFKDTLPDAPINQLAVLRLDGDMYESTIEALSALYHKVSYGGFVIVDDYHLSFCAQAVHDFRGRYKITSPILPIDGRVCTGVSTTNRYDNCSLIDPIWHG